jgi:hypothetical protein
MLRATLNVNKKVEIKNYPSLIAFIKRKSVGQLSKKSSVFAKLEVEKFLKEANNSTYLLVKVRFLYLTLKLFLHFFSFVLFVSI